MSALDDLYQRLILDHSRHPRNFGPLPAADHRATADNPFCSDRITVALALALAGDAGAADGGARVAEIRFEGAGCAICMAAASVMTGAVAGRTRAEIDELARRFEQVLSGAAAQVTAATAGDLSAFAAVARFPVRGKCARLPWDALRAALDSPASAGG